VIAVLGWKLCAGFTAGQRLMVQWVHSCMHCGEAQGDHGACVHRMLLLGFGHSLVWTSFALRTGLKAELGSFWDRTWCIPFCLRMEHDFVPTRSVIGLQSHTCSDGVVCVVGVYGGGGWIWS
jgi:hypothetical protein